MLKNFVYLCLLAAMLWVAPLSAQSSAKQLAPLPPSPFEGTVFTMSASAMRSAASGMPADNLSDATILYEETDYQFLKSGCLNLVFRLVYRIDTPRGVKNWAEASIPWDPWYQNSPQIQARVLRNDGTFVTLDQKTISDAPVNSTNAETYTSARVRKVPLPAISIGSIVEEVLSVDEKHPNFADGSAFLYSFANSAYTYRQKLAIELPTSLPFHEGIENLSGLTVTRSENGGMRRNIYERAKQPAIVYGDIDLPSATVRFPRVEFSTGDTWATVASGYASLSNPSIRIDQVQSLLPSERDMSRMRTIQLLVQRLHREVRYTGVEFDKAQLVPRQPDEVLKRHYGDCKDEATLLVTMLRASRIPAYLALLSAGTGMDINPDLPGLNRFNHAIVYIPASGKDADLWIDATAEFAEVGSLPYPDAGRFALIIAPDTKGLVTTPEATPQDSVLVETRTFTLADLGPSRVVETSETHGGIDAFYRSMFGGPPTKGISDGLEHYGKTTYLAKSLEKFSHGNASDLTKPFGLTLTFDGVRRGFTSLDDAGVAIFPSTLLYNLPKWITVAPTPLPATATPEQKRDRSRREAQRSPTYKIRPFVIEQHYRIVPPPGFTVRGLPPDQTTPLGPGSLTEHYARKGPDVTATLRFTTGKSIITVEEALKFREAVVNAYKRNAVMIDFQQTGVKLLAEGKVKDALTADRNAIAQEPTSALAHVRYARALLQVGVGELARQEAARAVELDPKSPVTWMTQGWVLQHNQVGDRFAPGFDRAGAVAAYLKALPLRTEDFDPRFDLAVLYEYDDRGVQFSPTADLPDAIVLFRSLVKNDQQNNSSELSNHRITLAYALLYNHDYKQVQDMLPNISDEESRSALTIAAAVAQNDVAAGLAAAARLNLSDEDRNKALLAAGNCLAQLGLYPQASSILTNIHSGKDAPSIAEQAESYRTMHRLPVVPPPVTSPESAVFAYQNFYIDGNPDRSEMKPFLSRHSFTGEADFERYISFLPTDYSFFHVWAQESGKPEIVLRDEMLSPMTVKSTGNDATGYRVIANSRGYYVYHYFVVREDGTYRIAGDTDNSWGTGEYVLYALDHHQLVIAKSTLDWNRDLTHKGGGDDPYFGPLLPRFWTVDSMRPDANSPEAMRVAAFSLLDNSMAIKPYLNEIVLARKHATKLHQLDFDLLLSYAYINSEQPGSAVPFIEELLKEEPDSNTVLFLAGMAYKMTGNTAAWNALLAPRLARRPADPDLLRREAKLLTSEHKYAETRRTLKAVFDSGQAIANDYNDYAWLGLFDDDLGPDVTEAAQRANALTKYDSFACLHTLASIYAAQGKVIEARQGIKQAMIARRGFQAISPLWYTFGLLYEDYGLPDAALAAYRQVKADPHRRGGNYIDPQSTYVLAQKRIAALTAKNHAGGSSAKN